MFSQSHWSVRVALLLIGACLPVCSGWGQSTASAETNPAMSAFETAPGEYLFRKQVNEVSLLFTVVDHKGKFISDLKLNDFQLLDDRHSPEQIHTFQQESNLPLRVALVIDVSGSVTSRFYYEQEAANEFFKKVMRPQDKAMVVGFNGKIQLQQDLTSDVAALQRAVKQLKVDGDTALYDAVVFAADRLRVDSENGTRRVIILISDGENNSSHAIMTEAQQAALRAGTPIYALSTNQPRSNAYPKGEAIMELLSRYTGGEILPAHEKQAVASAFHKVEKALRSQYVLSYKPANFQPDGHYRAVALSVNDPHLKVECRHGYYAPRN
ncbi:MAG TPA: VWA domain-containing protein [Terriglobales bacterium]|nr:VWA domain-containing protein [Terriglobales bacterium]